MLGESFSTAAGRRIVVVLHAALDAAGRVEYVLTSGVFLDKLNRRLASAALPPGVTMALVDRRTTLDGYLVYAARDSATAAELARRRHLSSTDRRRTLSLVKWAFSAHRVCAEERCRPSETKTAPKFRQGC
ncbi:MAG: hypothetical protein HY701_14590, partial [Gemmatimonadetes bacterium]|nr:hypothetical protein [Gemmatimonadota bacterium]